MAFFRSSLTLFRPLQKEFPLLAFAILKRYGRCSVVIFGKPQKEAVRQGACPSNRTLLRFDTFPLSAARNSQGNGLSGCR